VTLRQKQSVFARLAASLILRAARTGYDVTLGEAYRSPEEAARLAKLGKGIKTSLHTSRLALDLNLFKDGRYLTQTEDYRALGEWWEALSTEEYTCHWGGYFRDGNHFSIGHQGRK
jgi:hypothetical protein